MAFCLCTIHQGGGQEITIKRKCWEGGGWLNELIPGALLTCCSKDLSLKKRLRVTSPNFTTKKAIVFLGGSRCFFCSKKNTIYYISVLIYIYIFKSSISLKKRSAIINITFKIIFNNILQNKQG